MINQFLGPKRDCCSSVSHLDVFLLKNIYFSELKSRYFLSKKTKGEEVDVRRRERRVR